MQSRQERQRKIELNITLRTAIYLAITFLGGFLVGRVRIGETIWPFGVAYVLAAVRVRHAAIVTAIEKLLKQICDGR